jgi:hypothetical protein
MNALCKRIQDEKDPNKFGELLEELERLLESKRERIESATNPRHRRGTSVFIPPHLTRESPGRP